MAIKLSEKERKIYDYLQRIQPEWVSNTDLEKVSGIKSHQQVFLITHSLMQRGLIQGQQGKVKGREWAFSAVLPIPVGGEIKPLSTLAPDLPPAKPELNININPPTLWPAQFEHLAEQVMGRYFGKPLQKGSLSGVPKLFDLVSADGSVVGDAKFFTLVGGERLPPAKFSVIAEYVWLLEKTKTDHKFLVFGNQRDVPILWLKRYNHLVQNVDFFFLTNDGNLEKLNRQD